MQGIIRRIGSGEATNIWSMNWLPQDNQLRPFSTACPNALQWVHELIDPLYHGINRSYKPFFLSDGCRGNQFHPIDHQATKTLGLAFREGLALANGLSAALGQVGEWLHKCNDKYCTNHAGTIQPDHQGDQRRCTGFPGDEFVHERREANHDAHVLVRSSLFSSIGQHIWLFDPPDGICNSYSMT